jgi:TonB family protein
VPFPVLGSFGLDLISPGQRAWEWTLAGVFATAHLSALLFLRGATPALAAETLDDLETATYLDIPPPAEPQSARRVAKPRPIGVSAAVAIPAMQGGVVHPDKAAGFQELQAPTDVQALPPPVATDSAVNEKDFSGRGVVGGVAGGTPPPVIPAGQAADLAREGRLTDAAEIVRSAQPVPVELVTDKPRLLNRDEVVGLLLSYYPPVLRQAGVEGSALVQFVVDTSGRVIAKSVTVVSSTNPLFGDAAISVARRARFSPGRIATGSGMQAVPVTVRAPLTWTQKQ